ncbi:MAG TPA: ABC transporter permease subunit [Stellaceae bacterium]|jgi:NitT/TauT family transport system permease protein/sulfonate transport system permease protein|nr:ABC transporter permease subunit [Stellaceae bacterium]
MPSANSLAAAEDRQTPPFWTTGRRSRLAAHIFTLAFLVAWWGYSLTVPPFVLPGPVPVAIRLVQFFTTYNLYKQVFASLGHIAAGMAISFVVGSALALAAYYQPVLRLAVHGRLSPFLNSFSGIGWTLLSIVWFGVNEFTVVFAITVVLTPFAIINIREGLETLDRELLEMAASFTRNRWRGFTKIVAPALMPFVFATLRTSFGVSWKVALAAELFGGRSGLGYLFNLAQQNFDVRLILVVIAIIIAIVYGTDRLIFAPLQARFQRPDAGAAS